MPSIWNINYFYLLQDDKGEWNVKLLAGAAATLVVGATAVGALYWNSRVSTDLNESNFFNNDNHYFRKYRPL